MDGRRRASYTRDGQDSRYKPLKEGLRESRSNMLLKPWKGGVMQKVHDGSWTKPRPKIKSFSIGERLAPLTQSERAESEIAKDAR